MEWDILVSKLVSEYKSVLDSDTYSKTAYYWIIIYIIMLYNNNY